MTTQQTDNALDKELAALKRGLNKAKKALATSEGLAAKVNAQKEVKG
jgi:hypothetical protein